MPPVSAHTTVTGLASRTSSRVWAGVKSLIARLLSGTACGGMLRPRVSSAAHCLFRAWPGACSRTLPASTAISHGLLHAYSSQSETGTQVSHDAVHPRRAELLDGKRCGHHGCCVPNTLPSRSPDKIEASALYLCVPMCLAPPRVAQQWEQELAAQTRDMTARIGRRPHLTVILVGGRPDSLLYVTRKREACLRVRGQQLSVQGQQAYWHQPASHPALLNSRAAGG